jgi:hypothetical protein
MMELVIWSFVVTLPPLVFSVVVRILSVLAQVLTWYGARRVSLDRRAQPSFHCVGRRVRGPESIGHGV